MSMYDLLNNSNYLFLPVNSGAPLTDGDMLYGFIFFYDLENKLIKLYRGQLDLSDKTPHWSFAEVALIPDDFIFYGNKPFTMAMYQGSVYLISDPREDGACAMYSLADDGSAWNPEPDLPGGRICPVVRECGGRLYCMFGTSDDPSVPYDDAFVKEVYAFDGEKWEMVGSIPYIGRYHIDIDDNQLTYAPVTTVKNGFVFIGASTDGGGAFLYNIKTNQVEPLYYSADDTIADSYSLNASCAVTKDGVYYIRLLMRETVFSGYELYLLPASAGAYENPFEDKPDGILGDADGDGEVTIIDATAIQRQLASLPVTAFNQTAADADGDGEVTILDATEIQRHLVNLPANGNIGKPLQ